MYQQFFGFSEHPFNITPDPKFLYLSPAHREALSHLRYGIEQRKGFLVITGEVGCGKTLLCRTLLQSLDNSIFESAWLYSCQMSTEQLIRSVLKELEMPITKLPEHDHLDALNDFLLSKIKKGKEILLIIDEAQNLSYELLESIRLLSNLETEQRKLLQILLLGQPEFKFKLNQPQLRQLKQRILVYYELTTLSLEETKNYINHRLGLVSKQAGFPKFTYGAFRRIYKYTRGIPRVINHLCDKALISAYARLASKIEKKDIRNAIEDIERLST
ncbi:MAG: AAA family ATPase [Puniceicoccales bacterium]|jgi:general secretion pathway protein A|nr:AAA family ATPase [Puniceicoccales bacterium]